MLNAICVYIFLSFSFVSVSLNAQTTVIVQEADQKTITEIVSHRDSLITKVLPVRMVAIGKMLIGKPYVAKTLETGKEEQLVVNLRGFDCTTFLETTLTLAKLVQMDNQDFTAYCQTLTKIRYRGGEAGKYTARLHYLTEWLSEKQSRGEMEDITQKLGGVPYDKKIDFMTTHPQAYVQLTDKQNLAALQVVERNLNTQKRYYIPKISVGKIESQLQDGDIIAFTTNIKGLDVVHVGLAVRKGSHAYLLHASSDQKKVAVSSVPVGQYILKNSGQSGIIVVRLQQ